MQIFFIIADSSSNLIIYFAHLPSIELLFPSTLLKTFIFQNQLYIDPFLFVLKKIYIEEFITFFPIDIFSFLKTIYCL